VGSRRVGQLSAADGSACGRPLEVRLATLRGRAADLVTPPTKRRHELCDLYPLSMIGAILAIVVLGSDC
jgi:hypothetical protein